MPTVVKKFAPKKTTSSATVKKVTAKKSSAKKAGKSLVYAPDAASFWTQDGQILNSLQALHDVLATMDAAVYSYHARKDDHHFANWVEIVLLDTACAADLRKAKTATGAKTAIAKHLKTYTI